MLWEAITDGEFLGNLIFYTILFAVVYLASKIGGNND